MKSVLCEMEICTLRNENLYFAKWESVLCEMKSVLCEMKSVLCEMEICTLRNEICTFAKWNLYFAKWKSVLCEMKLLLGNFSWKTFVKKLLRTFYLPAIMTVTHIFHFCRGRRVLALTIVLSHNCFRLLVGRLCFVLLRDDYINPDKFDISKPPSRPG